MKLGPKTSWLLDWKHYTPEQFYESREAAQKRKRRKKSKDKKPMKQKVNSDAFKRWANVNHEEEK